MPQRIRITRSAQHSTIHLFMFAICCSVDVAVSNTFSQLITDELQLLHFDENNHLKCEQAQAQAKNQQKLNKNSTQNSSNNSNVRSGAPI